MDLKELFKPLIIIEKEKWPLWQTCVLPPWPLKSLLHQKKSFERGLSVKILNSTFSNHNHSHCVPQGPMIGPIIGSLLSFIIIIIIICIVNLAKYVLNYVILWLPGYLVCFRGEGKGSTNILRHWCHCTQQDDETTGGTGVFGGTEPPIYFSSLSSDWLVEACSQWAASFLFQSPMTDLKDSSLSLLLQITSSDIFGHADNVLSENSFQGWMGYKLSTPRVGYFFNCCFILLGRDSKGDQKESDRAFMRPGLGLVKDNEAP